MSILFITFIILAALVPGLAWLIFFLKEDVHPEPKKLIIYTFGIGLVMSVPIILLQVFGQSFILSLGGSFGLVILFFAFIEELFKFFACYLAVGKNPELDEPVDFMIYMVAAGLGLATIENFFILSELISSGGFEAIGSAANIIILRFVGATFLHAIASGIAGFYWARARIQNNKNLITAGIIFATAIHGIFNFLVLHFQNMDYLLYPSLFLLGSSIMLFNDFEKIKEYTKQD